MEQERLDPGGVDEAVGEVAQFTDDARLPGPGNARVELDAQHRRLRVARTDAHQRRATYVRMHVEHRLDLFGAQRTAVGEHDALRLAAAEPQAAVDIEISQVAHAVHDAFATVGQRLADLRQARGRVAVEVAVGRGGTGDRDLA